MDTGIKDILISPWDRPHIFWPVMAFLAGMLLMAIIHEHAPSCSKTSHRVEASR